MRHEKGINCTVPSLENREQKTKVSIDDICSATVAFYFFTVLMFRKERCGDARGASARAGSAVGEQTRS